MKQNSRKFYKSWSKILLLFLLSAATTLPILDLFPARGQAIATSTVGTTGNAQALGYSYDGFTCGSSGRYWAFFYETSSSSWAWKSSTDGVTWISNGAFPVSAIPAPTTHKSNIAFDCLSGLVYYAGGMDSGSDQHFYFNSGTLNSDGSISWNSETSVQTVGFTVNAPTIALDSSGNVWVAVQTQSLSGTSFNEVFEKVGGVWISWPTAQVTDTSGSPIPQLVSLTAGKMALLSGDDTSPGNLETFDGSAWHKGASVPAPASTSVAPQFSTAVALGDNIQYCASDGGSVWFVVYNYVGGTWGTLSTVASSGDLMFDHCRSTQQHSRPVLRDRRY